MTDDEKLAERCLERRLHLSSGQARDLAEKDFDWIKSKGAKPAAVTDASGSPTELSLAKNVKVAESDDHYVIRAGNWDKDELERMKNES